MVFNFVKEFDFLAIKQFISLFNCLLHPLEINDSVRLDLHLLKENILLLGSCQA